MSGLAKRYLVNDTNLKIGHALQEKQNVSLMIVVITSLPLKQLANNLPSEYYKLVHDEFY